MADLHHAFRLFHDRILPSADQLAALRSHRNAVRERIRRHFADVLKFTVPEFRSQGAAAMATLINPLNGEYDIDDGVYLQHLDQRTNLHWPAPEIVHLWVYSAVDGHAHESPVSRRACVRLRDAGRYRLDLPVYARLNGSCRLAECGARGWHRSDPMALVRWFAAAVQTHGEQFLRVVRYIKAWADAQSAARGKMPGGFFLTVLAVQNYFRTQRDDFALAFTFQSIEADTRPLLYLLNPLDAGEKLTERLTLVQRTNFNTAVASAADDALRAIQCASKKQAANLWRRQLGERFPE